MIAGNVNIFISGVNSLDVSTPVLSTDVYTLKENPLFVNEMVEIFEIHTTGDFSNFFNRICNREVKAFLIWQKLFKFPQIL